MTGRIIDRMCGGIKLYSSSGGTGFVKATPSINKHHIALFLKGSENTEMCFIGSVWHDGQKLLLEVKDSSVVGRYLERHVLQKWRTSSCEVP